MSEFGDSSPEGTTAQTSVEAAGGAAKGNQVPITTDAQLQGAVQHMLDGSKTLSQVFGASGINVSDIVITPPGSIPGEARTVTNGTYDSDGKLTGYTVSQIKVDVSKIDSRESLTDKVAHEIRHAWQFAEVSKGNLSLNGSNYSLSNVESMINRERMDIRTHNLSDYRRIPIEADAFRFGTSIAGEVKW